MDGVVGAKMASEESMDNPTNGSGGTHLAVFNLAEG
jgi:hypothetical protein